MRDPPKKMYFCVFVINITNMKKVFVIVFLLWAMVTYAQDQLKIIVDRNCVTGYDYSTHSKNFSTNCNLSQNLYP